MASKNAVLEEPLYFFCIFDDIGKEHGGGVVSFEVEGFDDYLRGLPDDVRLKLGIALREFMARQCEILHVLDTFEQKEFLPGLGA